MEREYFYSIEYWTDGQSKFLNNIVKADIDKISVKQLFKDGIEAQKHDVHVDTWVVKALSFNRV